jgi:hypothetical protein
MNTTPKGTQASPAIHRAEPVSKKPNDEPATSGEQAPEGKATETEQKAQPSSPRSAASRRNGQRSPGPTTPAGKRRSRQNALRHGFFSRWLVICDPVAGEDPDDYYRLHADIVANYHPVGFEENLRCEKIALCIWKLRRLTRYETGQITWNLGEHRMTIRDSANLAEADPSMGRNPEMDTMTDHLLLLSTEDLDRLSRYDSLINRQLNFAMAELERIQARRNLSTASVESA